MILLLGGSGYVGSAFGRELARRGLPHASPGRTEADLATRGGIDQLLDAVRPDWVVNAAGYTGTPNVDASERQKVRVLESNLLLPLRLAESCAARGIPLGHVSTGCLYSGCRADGQGFTEEDPPNFTFRHTHCSFYSGIKAVAEEWIAAAHPASWIWRIRRPFRDVHEPKNYLAKFLGYQRLLESENSITDLEEFVAAALDCGAHRLPFGILHMTNPGIIRTSEIEAALLRHGLMRQPARRFRDQDEFRRLAGPTPRSECVLDSSKALRLGLKFSEIHEALDKRLRNWKTL